jgi:hypothetical protein
MKPKGLRGERREGGDGGRRGEGVFIYHLGGVFIDHCRDGMDLGLTHRDLGSDLDLLGDGTVALLLLAYSCPADH